MNVFFLDPIAGEFTFLLYAIDCLFYKFLET